MLHTKYEVTEKIDQKGRKKTSLPYDQLGCHRRSGSQFHHICSVPQTNLHKNPTISYEKRLHVMMTIKRSKAHNLFFLKKK